MQLGGGQRIGPRLVAAVQLRERRPALDGAAEQATLPREPGMFGWIARYMLDALDSGSFASVPK